MRIAWGHYESVSSAEALATLQGAWGRGIRYFDVASMYGQPGAEHLRGQFLRDQSHRAEAIITKKVGRLFTNERPGGHHLPEPPKNRLDSGLRLLPSA